MHTLQNKTENMVLTPIGRVESEIKNPMLMVKGFEAVDGSPIIDIKPYVASYYGAENSTVPEWMLQLNREVNEDIF